MKLTLLVGALFVSLQILHSQTSFTWNGTVSTSWGTAANWTPTGVPGSLDDVTIVAATNDCMLNSTTFVNNITVASGTLDLNGNLLTISGPNALFTSGTVRNGGLFVINANILSFGSGAFTLDCPGNFSAATISIRNTTFQQPVSITKTGSTNDGNNRDNSFNAPATIANAGSGYLLMGNGGADVFNSSVNFDNLGSANLIIAYSGSNHRFNGTVTLSNHPSNNSNIQVSPLASGTVFNGDITVNNTSGDGIIFCAGSASASATLTAGHTLQIGVDGFSTGRLLMRRFTQSGNTPVNLNLTGTAEINFGSGTVMGGTLTVSAPNIYVAESTFNRSVHLTKTDGNRSNATSGGNIFYGDLFVNYVSTSGTGYWSFGNGAPDIYNGDVYTYNTSQDRIIFGHGSANNQFNGNLYISQTGSSVGTALTWNSGSSAIMAPGKTIFIGSAGLNSGYLYIQGLTQQGNAPMQLTGTGTSSIYFGGVSASNATDIGGRVEVTAPDVYFRGATFNEEVEITKTGGTSNHNEGKQNIFNGKVTINQQSSTGYFMLGYRSNDEFNDDIILNATGSGGINLGWTNGGGQPTLAAGKTIKIGTDGFNTGYLRLGGFIQHGTTAINLSLTGESAFYVDNAGTPCNIGGSLSVTAANIYIRGGIFNQHTTFTKTGGISNHNEGRQNIFNGELTINQQSNSGYFMLGYNADDQFNDDIIVTSSGSGGIHLGWPTGTGNPTLAAGKTFRIGGSGFTKGALNLSSFTQLGNAPVNLSFTGASTTLQIGNHSVIGGNLNASVPNIYLNGCTFQGTVDITKTGGSDNPSSGGNIFNRPCTLTNNSSAYLLMGNTKPDIWNDDLHLVNTGSNRILPAWATVGNEFNGNIYLNATGSSAGIQFCGGNNSASAILSAGKTIQSGSLGLNSGNLILKQFTQLGNEPVNLLMGNTATFIQFGPSSQFGGDITTASPGLLFNGCIFDGTVNATKTGGNNDASAGNNIFNKNTVLTNAGSGYLLLGNGNADEFNDEATFNNLGTHNIYVAYNSSGNTFRGKTHFNNFPSENTGIYISNFSSGTVFNEDIEVNSTNGQGVQFCGSSNSASVTLAAGKTISVGTAGFTQGALLLKQFTQSGNQPQYLSLSGRSSLWFGPSSYFGGNLTSTSPELHLNGCTFDGTLDAIKTGTTNDQSTGNNIFNKNTVLTNAGSGYLLLGNGNADEFNAKATFNNLGTHHIYVAYNSSNNIFRGQTIFHNGAGSNSAIYVSHNSAGTIFYEHIEVSSTNGLGVQFCAGNNTASALLSAGKTISVGVAGFTSGTLLLKQFTQSGTTSQNLNLTGTSTLRFGPSSSFGGDITCTSPGLLFDGCNFDGIVDATKTGTTNDYSVGNNIFHKKSTFTNNGTGSLRMASSGADDYQQDVAFVKNNTGSIQPNHNRTCTYSGDITVGSSTVITFGEGTGTAVLNGSSTQNIKVSPGTPAITFSRAIVNNTGGGVSLQTPINISNNLQLISGVVYTSDTDILTMKNNSTVDAGTALSTSYIDGPMQYQKSTAGSSSLNFPIGNGSDCRPVILTVNHTNSTLYTYRTKLFNASAEALGYTLPPGVDKVSSVHYYIIQRKDNSGNEQPTAGLSGNQTIQIFYGDNDITEDGYSATIVKNTYNNLTTWSDIGGNPATVTVNMSGDITSTSSPTAFNSFSTFALGFRKMIILPIELIDFNAENKQDYINLSWISGPTKPGSFFQIERSQDGKHFETILTVNGKSASSSNSDSEYYTAKDERPYTGNNYYRLKCTDADGKTIYSKIVKATTPIKSHTSVYPNPASNFIYITGLTTSIIHTEWYDISGRLVMAQRIAAQNGTTRIDLSPTLISGSYLLRYRLENGLWEAKRIIIAR